jgi:hypothetical protein
MPIIDGIKVLLFCRHQWQEMIGLCQGRESRRPAQEGTVRAVQPNFQSEPTFRPRRFGFSVGFHGARTA